MTSFSEVECVEIADTLRQSSYCVYIPGLYFALTTTTIACYS